MKPEKNAVFLNDDFREFWFKKTLKYLTPVFLRELLSFYVVGEGRFYKKEMIREKIIFVHIPKAAGTSVSVALFGARMGHFPIWAYLNASRSKYNDYYKFSIVRNPFSRLYSAWNYLASSPHEEDREWYRLNIAKYSTFEEFVMQWLSPKNVRSWKHFVPQVDYICINGDVAVDRIFYLENMQQAEDEITLVLGRAIEFSTINSTDAVFDMSVYTQEMKDKVQMIYRKDFEVLEYE